MKKQDKIIDIEEDLQYQKKSWRFQRIGMVGILLFILSALLGIAGNGPFSDATGKSGEGGFKVEYQKFARSSSPIDQNIIMNKYLTDNDTLKLLISKSFIHSIEIKGIIPEPAEQRDLKENIQYSFLAGNRSHPNIIRISYQFRRYGVRGYSLMIGGEQLYIKQFIWP